MGRLWWRVGEGLDQRLHDVTEFRQPPSTLVPTSSPFKDRNHLSHRFLLIFNFGQLHAHSITVVTYEQGCSEHMNKARAFMPAGDGVLHGVDAAAFHFSLIIVR